MPKKRHYVKIIWRIVDITLQRIWFRSVNKNWKSDILQLMLMGALNMCSKEFMRFIN